MFGALQSLAELATASVMKQVNILSDSKRICGSVYGYRRNNFVPRWDI
jgi:hypothetical protein